jgi:hypothetical protein
MPFWTYGAYLDKFRDPQMCFQSWWTYLTQRYKLKGLPCILLILGSGQIWHAMILSTSLPTKILI